MLFRSRDDHAERAEPHEERPRVTVLEAAMAPMVTGALLAQSAGLRPELAAAFVGIGVPVSFATVWGWALLTR